MACSSQTLPLRDTVIVPRTILYISTRRTILFTAWLLYHIVFESYKPFNGQGGSRLLLLTVHGLSLFSVITGRTQNVENTTSKINCVHCKDYLSEPLTIAVAVQWSYQGNAHGTCEYRRWYQWQRKRHTGYRYHSATCIVELESLAPWDRARNKSSTLQPPVRHLPARISSLCVVRCSELIGWCFWLPKKQAFWKYFNEILDGTDNVFVSN